MATILGGLVIFITAIVVVSLIEKIIVNAIIKWWKTRGQ